MPPRAKKASGPGVASLFRTVNQAAKANEAVATVETANSKIYSILEYIEQPWGLHTRLFPAQRFIVKLYYNLPLDRDIPEEPSLRIKIRDPHTGRTIHELSEYDYLKYLYSEGRCNIGEQDHDRRELVLAVGRRSGKSMLTSIFASYEVYRLLNLYNPQAYYGLPNGNRIQLISVATDKDQAGILFNEVTSHLAKCSYFEPYMANNTQSLVNFRTPYDIEKYGPAIRQEDGKFTSLNGKATIRLTFKSCIAKGLRGHGNIVIILDEVAHFTDKGNSSAEDIYKAVVPSKAAYSRKDPKTKLPAIDPKTGDIAPVEARIILISSPLGKSGKFYDKFDLAMRRGVGSENILAIQAPTWEINPSIPASEFKEHYHENPATFDVEFGAQFSDQVKGWIEDASILQACIDPALRPALSGTPRFPHQMGIDVGIVGDSTAISITTTIAGKIVLVYHETWTAGVPWQETNPHLREPSTEYARTLATEERLDFDAIAEWIQALAQRFYITAGIFDRWNGFALEQKLHKMGLKQFRCESFTREMTSRIYQTVKLMMYDEGLRLYDFPIPPPSEGTSRHCALVSELLKLQATQISKNITLVEAPPKYHDDMSDAFVRACWLTSEAMTNTKHISHGQQTSPYAGRVVQDSRIQAIRKLRSNGCMDRVVPRQARGGGGRGRQLVRR